MVKTRENLIGKRFGKLIVLKQDENDYVSPKGIHSAKWICKCDCGNTVSILGQSLKQGKSVTCGCDAEKFIRNLKRPRKNLIGKRFGKLIVIDTTDDYIDKSNRHFSMWKCKCDCGNFINVRQNKLIQNKTKSCGCFRKENSSRLHTKNLQGLRYGKLLVLNKINGKDNKSSYWNCLCDCGNTKIVRGSSLICGDTKSCGCTISLGEEKIRKYLINNNIKFYTQYWFNDLRNYTTNKPLYFDFAIKNDSSNIILIEFNGEQHYRDCGEFGKLQRTKTDELKRKYCDNHNIPLFIIKYNDDIENALISILN